MLRCRAPSLKAPMGGLAVDTKDALLKGGATGPVLIPGKPDESRILKALSYTDPELQMPPTGKLPESVPADFWGRSRRSANRARSRGISFSEMTCWAIRSPRPCVTETNDARRPAPPAARLNPTIGL